MPGDVANPVALSPNTRSDADARVQLHAHLKVPLQDGFGHRKTSAGRGFALEAMHHGLMIALLVGLWLGGGRAEGRTVDGFV